MWLFRGPSHMVNIVVVVLSPPGNCLCLGNRDAVSLDEASLVKKNTTTKTIPFLKNSSSVTVRSTDSFTHRPDFSFAQVNLLSLDFCALAQLGGPVSLAALCTYVAPRCREQFCVRSQE